MALARLLDEVRARPGDREHRQVLADALLERADPRGELMAASLAGVAVPEGIHARCIDRVRAVAPELELVRLEAGLVSELRLPLEAAAAIDPEWFAAEPLARLSVSLPGEDAELEPALDRAAAVLGACRGFRIRSMIRAERWPAIRELVERTRPAVLGLELGFGHEELAERPPVWPFVELAALSGSDPAQLADLLGESLPNLRRLSLSLGTPHPGPGLCIARALDIATLEHIDLRGVTLIKPDLAELEAWRGPGRSVRHEQLELGPPDLDDPFGASGSSWEAAPELRARIAAIPGRSVSFAVARGESLQLYLRDRPRWQRTTAAPITALAARRGELILGRRDGVIERCELDDGATEPIAELPGPIRSLSALGPRDLAATFAGGWWISRGGSIERGDEQLAALALTKAGSVRAEATRVIVRAGGSEQSVELGEPVRALAVDGSRDGSSVVAIAGRHVWRITGERLDHLGVRDQVGRPAIASFAGQVAWTNARTSAVIVRDAERVALNYPGTYSHDDGLELALADLCTIDATTVVTAIEHGGMNLLVPGGAMKADEFPGEPNRRWIFIYEGQILIAG